MLYSDTMGNMGAFIIIKGDDLTPQFTSFAEVVSFIYRMSQLCLRKHDPLRLRLWGVGYFLLFGTLSIEFMLSVMIVLLLWIVCCYTTEWIDIC